MSDRVRYVARPLARSGQKDARRAGLDRLQLGMGFGEKAIRRPAHAKDRGYPVGIVLRFDSRSQDHQIHLDLYHLTQEDVLSHDVELFADRILDDLGWAPLNEPDSFATDAAVKLFVGFAKGAHIHIKVIDLGTRLVVDLVSLLERVHTAEAAAVGVGAFIPAAHTMDNRYPLWRFPVCSHDLAAGRTGSVGQPLKLETGDDVGRLAIAIVRQLCWIPHLKACGQDDGAHL